MATSRGALRQPLSARGNRRVVDRRDFRIAIEEGIELLRARRATGFLAFLVEGGCETIRRPLYWLTRADRVPPTDERGMGRRLKAMLLEVEGPWVDCDVGNRISLAGDPFPGRQTLIQPTIKQLGLRPITRRPIRICLRVQQSEMIVLAEHRADRGHLHHQPFHDFVACEAACRQKGAIGLCQVEQNRARFVDRRAGSSRVINQHRNFAERVQCEKDWIELIAPEHRDMAQDVIETNLLQHNSDLADVWTPHSKELDHSSLPTRYAPWQLRLMTIEHLGLDSSNSKRHRSIRVALEGHAVITMLLVPAI